MLTDTAPQVRPLASYREAIQLAVPAICSMLSQTFTAAVETALLGYVGTVDQGAAGLGGALLWPFFIFCNCTGIGVQIGVAQAVGAQCRDTCGGLTWQGLYLSLLAWLLLIAVGLGAPYLVRLTAPNPALFDPTVLYLRIELFGGLPALVSATLVGCFRGLGDTRTPLMVTMGIQVLTICLDLLFIFGLGGFPRLGIAGVALATVSATTVGMVVYLQLFLHRGRREGWLRQLWQPFDRHACRQLVRVSWPVGVHGAVDMAAWTLFTALMARFGVVEAAAHAIAMRLLAMAYMAGSGVAVAATTLVGRYVGAQNFPAARRSMKTCLVLVSVLMGSMGLGYFVWRAPLVGLFTTDPAVVALAVQLLVFVALFQLCDGVGLIAMGVLRGAGNTRWPMLASLFLNWGVFVPGVALTLFVWHGGIIACWSVALAAALLFGGVMLRRVLRQDW